jgi:hypothetical protein
MTKVVDHLSTKCQALSSNSSTTKNKRVKKDYSLFFVLSVVSFLIHQGFKAFFFFPSWHIFILLVDILGS